MSARDEAMEAALRDARAMFVAFAGDERGAMVQRIDAALALPADDLPARMAEGLRPFGAAARIFDGFSQPSRQKLICSFVSRDWEWAAITYDDCRTAHTLLTEYEGRRDDR